jgi:hypothetical protein
MMGHVVKGELWDHGRAWQGSRIDNQQPLSSPYRPWNERSNRTRNRCKSVPPAALRPRQLRLPLSNLRSCSHQRGGIAQGTNRPAEPTGGRQSRFRQQVITVRSHGPHRVPLLWPSLGNWLLTLFSNMPTDLNLTNMETFCKAFRREVVQSIPCKTHTLVLSLK